MNPAPETAVPAARGPNLDELFDVVDAHDVITGQAPRREVHAKNLIHRATHVMIHDAGGRLFLQRRSLVKDTFPGCWDSSCSGHLDAGEDYAFAARRELGEELGWHDVALPLRPVVKLDACADTGHEFIQIFVMGPCEGPFALNFDEIIEGRWLTPAELDQLIDTRPHEVAGALRLLWANHRAALLGATGV